MACQGGFHCNLDCFLIPDLANENDLRVLPQKRPQDRVEGQANFLVSLCLADTLEIIFDRVFGSHDVQLRVIDMLQTSIERGCLARTGRAGHQHHALRGRYRLDNIVVIDL